MMQKKLLDVMPECYVDTNLIEYLLDAGVNHQHSCTKVVGQLKTTFANRFAVGIIDKDKVELGYIAECEKLTQNGHLTLLRHRTKSQYLILVSPAIDRFILDCVREEGVDLQSFGIPSTLKGFTGLSKSVTSNKDVRFKQLFVALKDNLEIKVLRETLEYLCTNKYKSETDVLKQLFAQQQ